LFGFSVFYFAFKSSGRADVLAADDRANEGKGDFQKNIEMFLKNF